MPSTSGTPTRSRGSARSSSAFERLKSSYGFKERLDRADSYVSRYVYRPVSFYLAVPFVCVGCSANQVTILRAVLALLSAVLVAFPNRGVVLLGSVLYAFCVLLDYVDGNLARLHGSSGSVGARLEEIADQVGPSLFPFGIGVGLYLRPDRILRLFGFVHPVWMLIVGALTLIAYCLGTMAILYIRLAPSNVNAEQNVDAHDIKSKDQQSA